MCEAVVIARWIGFGDRWTLRYILKLPTMTQEIVMAGRDCLDIWGKCLRFFVRRILENSGSSVHVLLIDQ